MLFLLISKYYEELLMNTLKNKQDKTKSIYEEKLKSTTTAGFEPARETPRDFESLALTTRPNCQLCQLTSVSLF